MPRVLIADDHQMIRDLIRTFLTEHLDMTVVGEAGDGRMAVRLAMELKPDVVLMDIGMPRLNGVEATRQIASESPNSKIVALTMHSDRRFVERMLQSGASGFVVKSRSLSELSEALETVLDGGLYLSEGIADDVIRGIIGRKEESQPPNRPRLTPRENEVLQLVAEGRMTKDIANELGISVKTVETHRGRIMNKLGLKSVASLTRYAISEGITTLDETADEQAPR